MAIDSAIASGVRHIVYSSLAYGGLYTCPPFACQPMLAHVDTEAYLRSVQEKDPFKISFTIVRVGLYAEGFDLYTAAFDINAPPADGLIKIPHDGSGPGISWAKKDELGEGVARVLQRLHKEIETEQYQNKLLVLSGPKDYSLADTAEVLSSVLGKDIKIKEVSVDEYANQSSVQVSLFLSIPSICVACTNTGPILISSFRADRNTAQETLLCFGHRPTRL